MRRTSILASLILIACLLLSCKRDSAPASATREDLFHVRYGRFEDEILFDSQQSVDPNVHLYMQDGFFFITNGTSKKVMQFTSYGDLLAVWYNADTNAIPDFDAADAAYSSAMTTQQSVPYPFNTIGSMAIDSHKSLSIVDELPIDRQEQDDERGLLMRKVVLRFARDGRFIDYIGQEGPGGTPFPYIKALYTTRDDSLVVISQTDRGFVVYWYDGEGLLRYSLPFEAGPELSPFAEGEHVYFSIENIIPDYNDEVLYLKLDYFRAQIDPSSRVQAGIGYDSSLIYPFDIKTGSFGQPWRAPAFSEVEKDGFGQVVFTKPYELLGVTKDGSFFFIAPDATGYMVEIVEQNGGRIIKKHLDIAEDQMRYTALALSVDGIISALLASDYEAQVVWWRTDKLLDSGA